MSLVARTLLNLSIGRSYSTGVRYMCRFKREISKPTITSGADLLMQNLKNATTTKTVLDLVGSHHPIMNNKHLIQALRALFTLQKFGSSDMSTQQILKHPNFEKMCQQLKTQAGLIELHDTIDALKVVCYVGVSSDSVIIQVLLQLLRHNINDLSLQQIIFLDFLISQLKQTPLVEALQIALPIVFEIQLPTKMDRHSITHLADYLQFVSKKTVSDRCIETIVDSLLASEEQMSAKTAYSIIWSICDMKPHEYFKPLLKKALDALIVDVDSLSYREMETTLSKMLNNYSYRMPFYYSDIFCDICANYVIDNDLGFDHAIFLSRKFLKASHSSDKLLNYISEKILEEPNLILYGNVNFISSLIYYLAMTDFRPNNWDILKSNLEQTAVFETSAKKDLLWVKIAASLSVLDIYKVEVIEKVFEEGNFKRVLQKGMPIDLENILLINQAVKTYRLEYSHLLPDEETITNIMTNIRAPLEYPLEMPLQKAFGGEQYVKTKLWTKMGHQIDHVVLFRKGGYPVAFNPTNKNTIYMEDIEKTLDSNIVIILGLGPANYDSNMNRLKGNVSLSIKTLEAQGYTVVPVCLDAYESLQDFEKIPYLMRAIKERTNNYLCQAESGRM